MIIVFFSRLFYPHIGGVEKHVLEIAKLMIADGHNVIVITETLRSDIDDTYERYNGIEIYRIPVGNNDKKKKWLIWKWLWQHKKLLEKADIVHAHDVFFWYLPFRFLYPRKKVYTTFHGYEAGYTSAGRKSPRSPRSAISERVIIVRKISEILSSGNICIGEFITKWYGTKPTCVIFGGINANQISNIKYLKTNNPIKIALIGRLEADIGSQMYIQALSKLKKENIQFSLKVFGDGNLRSEFEKYGIVNGFIENVWEKTKNADVIFASSYLTILETLARKKLVIAAAQNLLKRDYLEMTPFKKWINIAYYSEDIVQTVRNYTKNPKMFDEMKCNGYNWAIKQTWENVKIMYYKLWQV